MKRHLPLLCTILIFVQTAIGQEWKNIVPLKSTRTDVEKILGQPIEKDEQRFGTYGTSGGKIYVSYAIDRCKSKPPGWNVDADTVLEFSFVPNSKQPISPDELAKIYKANPVTISLPPSGRVHANPQEGTAYLIYENSDSYPVLTSIRITPKTSDNYLRCNGFPPHNAASAEYSPDIGFEMTDAHLKEYLGVNSLAMPDFFKLYVVTYWGSDMVRKKYDSYLRGIRRYISSKKRADQKKIVIIDGGRTRKSSRAEIFFLKKDYPPPIPTPDF
jgi:hypothetical protein